MTNRSLLLVLLLASAPAVAAATGVDGGPAEKEEVAATTSAPSTPEPAPGDPWEGYNRKVHAFNETVDRHVAKPLAKGYVRTVPKPLRSGITNFFRNLKTPVFMLNDLLQAKPRAAGQDLSRFLVNSTLGFAGFVDAATRLDMPRNEEDFGQTLGVWGVPNGPYLVLPFLGPSTVRDTGGLAVDVVSDPITIELEEGPSAALWSLKFVSTRANLLDVEEIVQGDRYLFLRDLYLQSRAFAVKDGVVESDPFLDEEDPAEAPADGEAGSGGTEAPAEDDAAAGEQAGPDEADALPPVQDDPATDGGE